MKREINGAILCMGDKCNETKVILFNLVSQGEGHSSDLPGTLASIAS